jgi:hypothetical protein
VIPVRGSISFGLGFGRCTASAAWLGFLLSSSGWARSFDGPTIRFDGYLELRWIAHWQVESGVRQVGTNDRAAHEVSGFALHRVRAGAGVRPGRVTVPLMIRLEESPPAILDAYVRAPVRAPYLEFRAGQMKTPATNEVAQTTEWLDFLDRSRFSDQVVDFSLSRSPAMGSPRFCGVKSYSRDMGVGLRGRAGIADYFLMIGNRLGPIVSSARATTTKKSGRMTSAPIFMRSDCRRESGRCSIRVI